MAVQPLRWGAIGLVHGVREYLEGIGRDDVSVRLGWRERGKQTNQGVKTANRIVFIPSDPNGNGGKVSRTQRTGKLPITSSSGTVLGYQKPLAVLDAQMTVFCWGHDPANPSNEEAQIEATWNLYELCVNALHATGFADLEYSAITWTVSPVELMHGREITFSFAFKTPILGRVEEVAMLGPDVESELGPAISDED